jgi:hypothetical protein
MRSEKSKMAFDTPPNDAAVGQLSADTRNFHVLALSGGGFRGLYAAAVLEVLELALGAPLASRFDLICGTSVGGLLALGLAAGVPAAALKALFVDQGRRIFGSPRGLFLKWFRAKHASVGLRAALTELFGSTTLGELEHRVLVPAVNYTTGKPQVFKTPHSPRFARDHILKLVDIGLATSAAPTYFPLHRIDGLGVFADGGLVGNSPGYYGLQEARRHIQVPPERRVRVLSVGTMTLGCTIAGSASLDRGLLQWASKVFDLTISAQEHSTQYLLEQELGSDYLRIDSIAQGAQLADVRSLDQYSQGAINVLTECGALEAQRALGLPGFTPFRTHLAEAPRFFYGPRARSEDSSSC